MDSIGVHSLGSAAAQGGQDTSTEHANGSHFTGWDMGVQASQDAPRHTSSPDRTLASRHPRTQCVSVHMDEATSWVLEVLKYTRTETEVGERATTPY